MRKVIVRLLGVFCLFALIGPVEPFPCEGGGLVSPSLAEDPDPLVDGKVALSALIALTDTHMANVAGSLEVLAETDEAKAADWNKMGGLLGALQKRAVSAVLWFVRPDGSYFTVDKGLTDKNLSDREYFPRLMAGKTVVGPLVISKSTGKAAAIAAAPIKRDSAIVGALGASIYLDKLSEQIKQELRLPDEMYFFAIDGRCQTALHSKGERIFQDPSRKESPSLTKAIDKMLSQPEGTILYEFNGKTKEAIFQTSPLTGWRFALGVETSDSSQ